MNIISENFNSISELMDTLNKRPQSEFMPGCKSSSTEGDERWYGTGSYKESEELIRTGYTEILPRIKEGLTKSMKVLSKRFASINLRRPENLPVGFIPNVPNSLLNLPCSMINIALTPQKRKTIHIIYVMSGSCATEAELWVKAGIALLTAVKIIEKQGISVKIDASFYCGEEDDDVVMGSVCVKHFGQSLDIQKLCFPLANPSMFRRIGFKFLETFPRLKDHRFAGGYGHGYEHFEEKIREELNSDKRYLLSGQWIDKHDYKVEEILSYLNFNKK